MSPEARAWKQLLLEETRDYFDQQQKAIHYLLVANGAGFAGGLAALKDYLVLPQLKGIGAIIVIFGLGFLMACNAYMSFVHTRQKMANRILFGKEEGRPEPKLYSEYFTIIFSFLSVACLSVAIFLIIGKVSGL